MTVSDFLAFYPQFDSGYPEPVLAAYADAANLRFTDFDEDAEEARRLYTAHKLTLWAKSMPSEAASDPSAPVSFASLAFAADGSRISSEKVDGVSVTYASSASASSAASSRLADLAESVYGLQLLTLLRIHACPRYIP